MCRLLALTLVCLLAAAGAADTDDAERASTSAKQHHQQKWREVNATTLGDAKAANATATAFRASMKDLGVKDRTGKRLSYTLDNKLRELFQEASAGENTARKKKQDDDDDEDKKTLAQQIADGKYGLIEKEIYSRPALRPGIISYKNNPEVPKDNIKNLGGLDAEEIWLAEDHVLVLRGGWFPNHNFNRTEASPVWPPIDDYQAPPRQVKLPSRPKVPPPFPVQLADGAPTHFIGPNGTKSNRPFPPPFFPFPPGDGFYPAPGNGSSFPPPPYPFPPENGSLYPYPENYPPPPPGSQQPYPPGNFPPGSDPSYPYPPPPHGFMPFPNGSSPYGPLPPFFPPLPPGAAFLPPPGNQTEPDEDDPSIYYPPPYDFFYPKDNSSKVPPGPLVPGIILPPPPNFFAPLNDEKPRTHKRPTSTPLPHVPLNVYPPTASPRPTVIRTQLPPGVYPPTASPRPPHRTQPPRVYPPTAAPRPPVQPPPERQPPSFYYPKPPPSTTYNSLPEGTTPPSPTPFGNYVPGQRPTVKRPYLTYVPVTTAGRKKKPRPTSTTPTQEFEVVDPTSPTPPPVAPRPKPPKFVSPQNVQVFYKGESPITVRPYYFNEELDNVVTVTPEPQDQREDNVVTSTPKPHYITDGLSKLKDILYSPPQPTASYHLDRPVDAEPVRKKKPQVTTVSSVKSVEYTTTEAPLKYFTDIEKRPIYVKDLDNYKGYKQNPPSTVSYQQAEIDSNSVHPTQQSYRGGKGSVVTTPANLYQSYQPELPNRTPKTTYYFYDEPHFEQGYVQDVPAQKPYVFNNPSKWQFDNPRPTQQPNYNQAQPNYNQAQPNYNQAQPNYNQAQPNYNQAQPNYNQAQQNYNQAQPNYQVRPLYNPAQANYNGATSGVNTQEEMLLAQIAETLRQPGNGYYYNSQNKQPQKQAYYNRPYYSSQQRPANNNYINTTPRPAAGFYITKKPEYYQTPAPQNYNGYNSGVQGNREFPYNYQDVSQSTEHPLPQVYNTTPRPQFLNIVTPSRLQGPDAKVHTSPKTVYEYSFQKQAADTTNYVSTERPPAPVVRRPTTTRYYEDLSQNVTPDTNNQIYQTSTSKPRYYPVIQHVTPDPLQNHFTQQDDSVLDDITKKYFTIFGQKLKSDAKFVHTTPLPAAVGDDKTRQHQTQLTNYENQPDSHQQQNYNNNNNGNVHKPTEIPLYDDVAVNYRTPRPPINPDSEFISPAEAQKYADDDSGGGKLISYKLPGNEGGHFYFVTPQVVQQSHVDVSGADSYQYPVPARGFRTRRNKNRPS